MNISGNTILITGGATGIGLALAEAFLEKNNEVIICGRREDKLAQTKDEFPRLHTYICDVADRQKQKQLYVQVLANHPDLNILVNNAGSLIKRVQFMEIMRGSRKRSILRKV